jgi:hypothetical protein
VKGYFIHEPSPPLAASRPVLAQAEPLDLVAMCDQVHVRRFEVIRRPEFRPRVAAIYGTNNCPRDRIRHSQQWDGSYPTVQSYACIRF